MASIYRSRVVLTGWEGAPGVNTIYWTSGIGGSIPVDQNTVDFFHDELAGLYGTMKTACVPGWTYTVQPDVDILDVASGKITGVIVGSRADLYGTHSSGTGNINRATQMCVTLKTDRWLNGRRLQGRYFWGPLQSDALGADGMVKQAFITGMEDAFIAMTSGVGARLAVYHRPSNEAARDGQYGDVVTVVPQKKPAVLRSRRD